MYLSTQIKYLIARHQNYPSALATYRFRVFYKNHIKICYIIAWWKSPTVHATQLNQFIDYSLADYKTIDIGTGDNLLLIVTLTLIVRVLFFLTLYFYAVKFKFKLWKYLTAQYIC